MTTNNNIILSIIIPVYGVENYINELMDSLFPQLTMQVECLFIDDGCLDQSIVKVQSVIEKLDDNHEIKIIHQANCGLSGARNTGILHARGEYITFLDSDDYVLDGYIPTILAMIEKHPVDIIHFNALKNNKHNVISTLGLVDQSGKITNSKNYLRKLLQKNHWYAWLRVIHKDLLKDFQFPVGYVVEDSLAIPYLYKKAQSVYEIVEPLVFYRYREGSIMNSGISEKRLQSYEKGIADFKVLRNDEYFRGLYEKFIIYSLKDRLLGCYSKYCEFVNLHYEDLCYIRPYLDVDHIHWKTRLMIYYPKTFYCYKVYTRAFNIRRNR